MNETRSEQLKLTEQDARQMLICPACGKPKQLNSLVCWYCFKYRIDIIPLKYSSLNLIEFIDLARSI